MSEEGAADPTTGGTEDAEVEIHGIASGGAGVGRLPSGKAVFVHRTAPGDRVRVRVTQEGGRWARGELQELLRPGPGRREAPCPYYARCGGCTLEHLEYDRQLEAKAGVVRDALRRIGGVEASVPEVEASPRELRYRSRASFTLLRTREGRTLAGFHELERPGRIVDVDGGCLLLEEDLARVWDQLRGAWGPGARRLPRGRKLRLTLQGTGEGVVLTVRPQGRGGRGAGQTPSDAGSGDAEGLVEDVPALRSVWWQPPGEEARRLAGEEMVPETRAGQTFAVRGGSFLQANRGAAEALHGHVLRQVGPPRGSRVVDAYCGVGGYGRTLARHGARVTGIELDPAAVRSARETAPSGLRILEGTVEARLEEALPAECGILNPPRRGVARDVTDTLLEAGPAKVIYVSCDPATLARDLARLHEGYGLEAVRCFDLFPQTAHVETVATLRRRDEPDPTPGAALAGEPEPSDE